MKIHNAQISPPVVMLLVFACPVRDVISVEMGGMNKCACRRYAIIQQSLKCSAGDDFSSSVPGVYGDARPGFNEYPEPLKGCSVSCF